MAEQELAQYDRRPEIGNTVGAYATAVRGIAGRAEKLHREREEERRVVGEIYRIRYTSQQFYSEWPIPPDPEKGDNNGD